MIIYLVPGISAPVRQVLEYKIQESLCWVCEPFFCAGTNCPEFLTLHYKPTKQIVIGKLKKLSTKHFKLILMKKNFNVTVKKGTRLHLVVDA